MVRFPVRFPAESPHARASGEGGLISNSDVLLITSYFLLLTAYSLLKPETSIS